MSRVANSEPVFFGAPATFLLNPIQACMPCIFKSAHILKHMIPFSILDLSPIAQGSDAAQSFRNSRDLARQAEQWGFRCFWLAKHHGMPGVASAATSVLMAYVAAGTTTIRVGAGGIMLPNHSPLVIAEQFGTLESLYPGRIDLGLGRAPGSDQLTARALPSLPGRRKKAADQCRGLLVIVPITSWWHRLSLRLHLSSLRLLSFLPWHVLLLSSCVPWYLP